MSTIYLYIKQHNLTGLKYFGRTIRNPYNYHGSGKYWKQHILKHGKSISTLEVFEFNRQEECSAFALEFSEIHNIVESNEWANLTPENGIDGSGKRSKQTRLKMSASHVGKTSGMHGKKHTPVTRQIISSKLKGSIKSEETKRKMSESRTGVKRGSYRKKIKSFQS